MLEIFVDLGVILEFDVMLRDAAKVSSGNVIPFVSRPDKDTETKDGPNGR